MNESWKCLSYGKPSPSYHANLKSCVFVNLNTRQFILINTRTLFGGMIYDDTILLEARNYIESREVFPPYGEIGAKDIRRSLIDFEKTFSTSSALWRFLKENCHGSWEVCMELLTKEMKKYD